MYPKQTMFTCECGNIWFEYYTPFISDISCPECLRAIVTP